MASKYESYDESDSSYGMYGVNWYAQTFLTISEHTVSSVRLLLQREGTIGTMTVSIKAVDGGGQPTGGDLVSGVFDASSVTLDVGGDWYEVTMDSEYDLEDATTYAIVMRLAGGDSSNEIRLRGKAVGDYADGAHDFSNNSGASWTGLTATDHPFEIWGAAYSELAGTIAGTSATSGDLNVILTLEGTIVSTLSLTGVLFSEDELICATVGTASLTGSLSITTKLQGITAGDPNITGRIEGASILLGGHTAGASGVTCSLSVIIELQSSVVGTSGTVSSLTFAIVLLGSFVGTPSLAGFLSVVTELQGVCIAIFGTAGVLDFAKTLRGASSWTSSLIGRLEGITPVFNAIPLLWRPQSNILEVLDWNTSILKSYNGTEQRIKVRQTPRQYFKISIVLDTDKTNSWYDSVIHTWQKLAWLFPVWTEYIEHTSNITINDKSIFVDTANADFRANSKAIVWKSATEYEVVVVGTVEDLQLNIDYSMLTSFTGTKYICPVRTAYITSMSKKKRSRSGLSIVDLIFTVEDNEDIAGYVKTDNYDNIDLLATPAFINKFYNENSNAELIITDYTTGVIDVGSNTTFNVLSQDRIFFNDTKADCWSFKKWLCSLNGRQRPVLIPTFRGDVVLDADICVTDTSIDIENIDISDNMGINSLRTYIGFYFTDGTLIVRKITGIDRVSPTVERISIDYNLDRSIAVEPGDCKIGFVDKCRLTSDRIEINWEFAHRNKCKAQFTRVI